MSDIGLSILASSHNWWCDGTFKSSPTIFYQHNIIHGKYKDAEIENLKLPCVHGELDIMDFLMTIKNFIADFD